MFPLGIHCGGARGWAGLSRGWGILGVRAACSGKAGGGGVGGPGWRGHYNAVNTFKF